MSVRIYTNCDADLTQQVCCYCDNPVFSHDDPRVITDGDTYGIAHASCHIEALNSDDE